MSQIPHDPRFKSSLETLETIHRAHDPLGAGLFLLDQQVTFQVQIRASLAVELSKFRPDPLIPGGYIAHPQTIRAMRKDLFVTDPELLDFEAIYTCPGCAQTLDLQFWQHCPYCERGFQEITKK